MLCFKPHLCYKSWWQWWAMNSCLLGISFFIETGRDKLDTGHSCKHWRTLWHTRNTPGCIFPCFYSTKWQSNTSNTQNASPECIWRHWWGCGTNADMVVPPTTNIWVEHPHSKVLPKNEANWTDGFRDTAIFVSSPCCWYDHYQTTQNLKTWPQNQPHSNSSLSLPRPQLNAIASVLTARTTSISLPTHDWDSKDAYHSFSIFQHTLENWLLLNCIMPDSEDHLWYVFAALGTKSLEIHVQ